MKELVKQLELEGMKKPLKKILRDNIQGITQGAIHRLAYKAGVYRVSSLMLEEIRGVLKAFLETLVQKTVIFAEVDRRKRVMETDVRKTLKLVGHEVAEAESTTRVQRSHDLSPSRTVRTDLGKSFSTCGAKPYTGPRKQSPERKPVHYKPGTQTIRNIKFYQKQSSCFSIGVLPFSRLVREVARDFKQDLQFSPEALHLLQFATENYIISLLQSANEIVINGKRKTILPKDLHVAYRVKNENL